MSVTEALLAAAVVAFIAGHGLKKLALLAAILILFIVAAPLALASDMPPFKLGHPLCPTGFTLAQRFDTRDSFGIIVKREWKMTGCAKGRIVYGRKV
jgi:hypothetical protein